MDLYNLVVAGKVAGGGGGGEEPVLINKNIDANGTYNASSDSADGYKKVVVSVPSSGITPSGTKDITSNGIYDVTDFASASVSVPGASGTSVITSNGIYDIASFASASVNVPGIVPSGTSSITANGIYDITNFASVDVNVSGGGGGDHDAEDAIITKQISGTYTNDRVTMIGIEAFFGCSKLEGVSFDKATEVGGTAFGNCFSLKTVSLPSVQTIYSSAFLNCSALTSVYAPNVTHIHLSTFNKCSKITSLSFPKLNRLGDRAFQSCISLSALYLLNSSIVSNTINSNVFMYTPMALSSYLGYFGSIYVPASLVDSYKAANGWSYYSSRITAYEG